MFKQPRSVAPFALKCALLFLAFAVFGWGLHAKLSLYKAPQSPSTATVAKLSTEKHSAQTLASLEKHHSMHGVSRILKLVSLAASIRVSWSSSFRFHQVEVSLCKPCRCDLQGPDFMRHPPPALS